MAERYNGWRNYETWCCKLWIDNEEGSYRFWRSEALEAIENAEPSGCLTERECAVRMLADRLQEEHEQSAPDMENTFYSDIMSAALSEVDWYEISESLIEDNEE